MIKILRQQEELRIELYVGKERQNYGTDISPFRLSVCELILKDSHLDKFTALRQLVNSAKTTCLRL